MNVKKPKNNYRNQNESKDNQNIQSEEDNKFLNKNLIRKRKRLFQMQKRLANINGDDHQQNETDCNQLVSDRKNEKSFQKYSERFKNNQTKENLSNFSFNYSHVLKNDIINDNNIGNKSKTNFFIKEKSGKKVQDEEIELKLENLVKEEDSSYKKKNTFSNTNDEDRSTTEIIFSNELEQFLKKSAIQNESFNEFTNEEIEAPNSKEFISVNLTNNSNSKINSNIINMMNNDIEIKEILNNDIELNNSVIINEDDQDNNNNIDNKEENVELNISNLDIDLIQDNTDNNDGDGENEEEILIEKVTSNEFAKKYLSSKSKSFIQFNNNLASRVAANSLRNSPSYMMALCPELLEGINRKRLIKDNYAVADAISEEGESENVSPKHSEKNEFLYKERKTIDETSVILRQKRLSPYIKYSLSGVDKGEVHQISNKKFKKNININRTKNRIKERSKSRKNIELSSLLNSKKKDYSDSFSPKNDKNNSTKRNFKRIKDNLNKQNNNDKLNIKFRHQKAKSLIEPSQISTFNLYKKISKNKNISPKQLSKDNQNKSNYIMTKMSSKDKKDYRTSTNQKRKYFSNENNKSNSTHTIKKKANKNEPKKQTNYNNTEQKNSKINKNKYKKLCNTEKQNKSKNYIDNHIRKKTPVKTNNITDRLINHRKKLSQQIKEGHKFFINSLNEQSNIKKCKTKLIGINNYYINRSSPLNSYLTFNKNITNNNSLNSNNNSMTFINKTDKKNYPIPSHNKSKTSLIAPSYKLLKKEKAFIQSKALINSNKKNIQNKANIKKKYLKNYLNKFNEIKKVVKDSSIRIIHKKINTIGNSNDLTKLICSNSKNRGLKNSESKKIFNKHKIIRALQHIKFEPTRNYTEALNELYKSKKNLFVILVNIDSNNKFIFKGLYEVNATENKTATKLFGTGIGDNNIHFNNLNGFFNYQNKNPEFIKTNFKDDKEKKFNSDTVLVY